MFAGALKEDARMMHGSMAMAMHGRESGGGRQLGSSWLPFDLNLLPRLQCTGC